MNYSGNPSLSADAQQRILVTFQQTLDLAERGSREEALLGCDFVLRMDPQFAAARTLQERLRASAGAVVDTDDLRALATGAPAPAAAALPADLFADLDGLGLELPELPAGAADLHAELNGLLERRQFQELLALAEREHGAVMSDPRLLGLVQEGQSRMEAEPYVQKFLASARTGEVGDGKIFVQPIERVVRIRTGELDNAALTAVNADQVQRAALQSAQHAGAVAGEEKP